MERSVPFLVTVFLVTNKIGLLSAYYCYFYFIFLLSCSVFFLVELWELFICYGYVGVCVTHFIFYTFGYIFTILILVNKIPIFDTMYYYFLVLGPEVMMLRALKISWKHLYINSLVPPCRSIGKWWGLYEMRPDGRKLGHWANVLKANAELLLPPCLFALW